MEINGAGRPSDYCTRTHRSRQLCRTFIMAGDVSSGGCPRVRGIGLIPLGEDGKMPSGDCSGRKPEGTADYISYVCSLVRPVPLAQLSLSRPMD